MNNRNKDILENKDTTFEKKICCYTGFRPKKDLIHKCITKNFKFTETINKNCEYLICKNINNISNKIKKANKYNIKILSLDKFLEMLNTT